MEIGVASMGYQKAVMIEYEHVIRALVAMFILGDFAEMLPFHFQGW